MILIAVTSALGSTVNPWPRDGWYQTQYVLFGHFPQHDDYTPVAAPAVLYWIVHRLAVAWHWGLADEFYLASVVQNILALLSACCVYYTGQLLGTRRSAGLVAVGFLLLVTSSGLPQAFWSESITIGLMAVVVQLAVILLYQPEMPDSKFLSLAALCGLTIGVLVVTRLTPVFLIPGLLLVFFRRIRVGRLVAFSSIITLTTVVIVIGAVTANYQRFGRYELTNSSGRHLWQGVRSLSDRALASSEEYQALKKRDANLAGKNWWEFPDADSGVGVDRIEPVLKALATQAILNRPGAYLLLGLKNFATAIGEAPYRLGFGQRAGNWDPLNRDTPLPSLLESKLTAGPASGRMVGMAFRGIHRMATWVYPATILAIIMSYVAMLLGRTGRRTEGQVYGGPLAFFGAGIPVLLVVVSCFGLSADALIAGTLCLSVLIVFAKFLRRSLAEHARRSELQPALCSVEFALYSFLILIFVGSLWFSWQVEARNSRVTLQYLPFWAIAVGMAANYWTGKPGADSGTRGV